MARVWHANPTNNVRNGPVSEPDVLEWKTGAKRASTMGGYFFADGQLGLDLTDDGPPRRLGIAAVSAGVFETLRAAPRLDRVFTADDQLAAEGLHVSRRSRARCAAFAGTMQSVLYHVPAVDPVTFAQLIAVLLGAALVASVLPVRRALAIDQATALRSD